MDSSSVLDWGFSNTPKYDDALARDLSLKLKGSYTFSCTTIYAKKSYLGEQVNIFVLKPIGLRTNNRRNSLYVPHAALSYKLSYTNYAGKMKRLTKLYADLLFTHKYVFQQSSLCFNRNVTIIIFFQVVFANNLFTFSYI